MTSNREHLRNLAWRHIRWAIGDHYGYNDQTVKTSLDAMNATELAAVAAMSETEMVTRFAPEPDDT